MINIVFGQYLAIPCMITSWYSLDMALKISSHTRSFGLLARALIS